jgi:hypothetical protein
LPKAARTGTPQPAGGFHRIVVGRTFHIGIFLAEATGDAGFTLDQPDDARFQF